ncbi:MAG: hypothetical protein QW416_04060 [Candidatus Nitrosocaldaceae archaeon]
MIHKAVIGISAILVMTLVIAAPIKSYAANPLTLGSSTIPVGGTMSITFTNIYGVPLPTVSIVVLEPDGDVCRVVKHWIAPGSSFTVIYPTDFNPDAGSIACDTNIAGEYHVKSRAGNPAIPGAEAKFLTSFFVVPESPIGAVVILGSSIAVIGSYMMLKKRQ